MRVRFVIKIYLIRSIACAGIYLYAIKLIIFNDITYTMNCLPSIKERRCVVAAFNDFVVGNGYGVMRGIILMLMW